MPALDGSERSVAWAGRVRHALMVAAFEHAQGCGVRSDDFAKQVEAPARKITSASWWIDQRDASAEEVAELVIDAASTPVADTGTENPY
jgi:hypothetical protein